MSTLPDNQPLAWLQERIDPFKVGLWVLILIAALFVWSLVRTSVVQPLDELVTEQLCETYGEEIGRTVTGYERSNRFGLRDRSVGYCLYGPGPDGEPPATFTIEATEPGNRYRAAKAIGIIIQLGIVSIFLRFVVDPVMELYQAIRRLVERFLSRP